MINFNNVSNRIFQILKGSGYQLSIFDSSGNNVYDPSKGRKFFANPIKVMVTVEEKGDNSEIKLYLSKSTSENLYSIQPLINSLRETSIHYNLKFTVRKYGRELSPRDFAFLANSKSSIKESYFSKMLARDLRIAIDQDNTLIELKYKKDKKITEAFESMYGLNPDDYKENKGLKFDKLVEGMYGTSKSSYQKIGSYRIIIRHSSPIHPETIGSRGKKIEKIFIQTPDGERVKYPFLHLNGARAMVTHLIHNGDFRDSIGTDILNLSESYIQLKELYSNLSKNKIRLSESDNNLKEIILNYIKEIRNINKKIISNKGYDSIKKENGVFKIRQIREFLDELIPE